MAQEKLSENGSRLIDFPENVRDAVLKIMEKIKGNDYNKDEVLDMDITAIKSIINADNYLKNYEKKAIIITINSVGGGKQCEDSVKKKINGIRAMFWDNDFLFRTDVFAMTGDEFATFMRKNQAWLVSNNLFLDIAHTIGWALVKGCATLSDLCQSLYSYSLGLIDFTTYEPLQQWIATLKGLFQVLLTVSLVFAGTVMMIDHEKSQIS